MNFQTVGKDPNTLDPNNCSETVQEILARHEDAPGSIMSILTEIQALYGYLPEDALRSVSERLGKPLVDLYGVATFYRSFSLKPRGKHLISVCLGTACHVRGASRVAEEFQRQLGIRPGETTQDREFTFETVACLGACALGPVVMVDGHYFSKMRKSKVSELLEKAREGFGGIDIEKDERIFPIQVRCSRCNHSLMDAETLLDSHPSIRVTVSADRRHGWLRLSSLYGSPSISSEHEIAEGTETNFFCPHCHSALSDSRDCSYCGAALVSLIVEGGGTVQICSRRGCEGRTLELV